MRWRPPRRSSPQVGEHWAGAEGRAYVRVSPGCQLWPGHPLNKRRWGNQGEPKNTFGSLVPPRIAPPHNTQPHHPTRMRELGGQPREEKNPGCILYLWGGTPTCGGTSAARAVYTGQTDTHQFIGLPPPLSLIEPSTAFKYCPYTWMTSLQSYHVPLPLTLRSSRHSFFCC